VGRASLPAPQETCKQTFARRACTNESGENMRILASIALMTMALNTAAADSSTQDACRALIMDYAYYRDHPDVKAYGDLFTEDAELSILGDTRIGRSAIRERLAEVTGSTVHLMSTIRITEVSATEATGVSYVTVYTAPDGAGPHTVSGYAGIGEYHDVFRKTVDGWKIAKRTLVMRLRDASFQPPGPPSGQPTGEPAAVTTPSVR
jgi:ketosteroid isomerase-like protein